MDDGKETLFRICQKFPPQEAILPEITEVAPSQPLIEVVNLQHTYPNGTKALHNISLKINQGEYVLIIGQNGAGKSTLVRHFLKLLVPTEGEVLIGRKSTHQLEMSELARNIGYIAQNPDNQIFTANVEEEVAFALRNLGFSKDVVKERTLQSLENMGLLEYKELHPLSLPKGDRARIVIAAILAMEPDTIIFDEPTTGQDFRGAKYILDISKKLHQQGKTVIVITHHLYLMPDYAQRVIVMGKGSILLDAPIRTAFHEVDILRSTYLSPPQSVELARYLREWTGRNYPLITPDEIAGIFDNHMGTV
jgi:energy-coupling factor transport system ATP-binding protein